MALQWGSIRGALIVPLPASLPDIGSVIGFEEAICWTAFNKPSNDTALLVNDAGELALDNGDDTFSYIDKMSELPQSIVKYLGAQTSLHRSLCEGLLNSFVAPDHGLPLKISRHYWNRVEPGILHQIYQGVEESDMGMGCPILLSRKELDAWRNSSVAPTPQTPPKVATARPSRPGRTKGSGSMAMADKPLLVEMRSLIAEEEAFSAEGAAKLVWNKAAGNSTEASKTTRLAKRFRDAERNA